MRRLDWQLVRPDGEGDLDEPMQLMQMIRRLATKEGTEGLDDDETDLLAGAEESYLQTTLSHCDAVDAPLVEQDPDWESRVIDEYAVTDVDLELEDFLNLRKREPDCDHCPFASPYSLYPMDPCEFSAGALEVILIDNALRGRLNDPMKPLDMFRLADDLDAALADGAWREVPVVDARDYITKATLFLRFWAQYGFGLLPTDVDEVTDFATSEAGVVGDDDDPPIFH